LSESLHTSDQGGLDQPAFGPATAFLSAAVLAAAAILIFAAVHGFHRDNLRALSDEQDYHLHVIQQFSDQWPRPDLRDYRSATGPGYHLPLAAVHHYLSRETLFLRMVAMTWTILLLGGLGWAVSRHLGPWRAIAVCCPVVTSLYVVVSVAYLLPDNLAWLTVLLSLLLAYRGRVDWPTCAMAAITLAAAVFVRQINLWPLAPLMVMAAMSGRHQPDPANSQLAPPLSPSWIPRAGTMLLMAIPAGAVLLTFWLLWGGLTPPAFQTVAADRASVPAWHSGWQHEGPNPAVPAMILAVLGTTGLFFGGLLLPAFRAIWQEKDRRLTLLIAGLIGGALTAVIVPSTWSESAGRYSGLWNISKAFPALGDREHDQAEGLVILVPSHGVGGLGGNEGGPGA
jgi:hypothetical protein